MLYYEDFGDADADNADLSQSKDIFAKVWQITSDDLIFIFIQKILFWCS